MKHLLIILSLLLLSSPVISKDHGVLYLYETSSGIQWKTVGDPKVQPEYRGRITNMKPHGTGILKYPNGKKKVNGVWSYGEEYMTKHWDMEKVIVVGKYLYGEWREMGVLYHSRYMVDGKMIEKWLTEINMEYLYSYDRYVGEINNGKPNGQGRWDSANRENDYVGEWKDGRRHGHGKSFYGGITRKGEWKNGKGWNVFVYDEDGKYRGKIVNGNWEIYEHWDKYEIRLD